MPDFITPCLATLSSKAPSSDDWVHEIKFDGYRMQARIGGGEVSLKTRTGLDWTHKFPTIAEAIAALADHDVILDGEIASFDANGVSDFSALQDDLKNGRHDRLVYYVFDLLHLDGQDLTAAPLLERKRALAELLAGLPQDGVVRLSEHFEEDGATMLKHARDLHLEGIISKRADAPYRSGRSGDWLKIKCSNNQEFIVIGYEPSDKRGRADPLAAARLLRQGRACATPDASAPAGARTKSANSCERSQPRRATTRRSTRSPRKSAAAR